MTDRPVVREGAQHKQNCSCPVIKIRPWDPHEAPHQYGLTAWPSVSTWLSLTTKVTRKNLKGRPPLENWHRWIDIKMDVKGMRHGITYGFSLLTIHYRAHVKMNTNLRIQYTWEFRDQFSDHRLLNTRLLHGIWHPWAGEYSAFNIRELLW
jgi:hypothetical protein